MSDTLNSVTLTIANGATVSDGKAMPIGYARRIFMPDTFTGTALTFSGSLDGVTYQPLYDRYGTAVTLSVAAGRSYSLPFEEFEAVPNLKITSNAAEGAARSITVVARRYG